MSCNIACLCVFTGTLLRVSYDGVKGNHILQHRVDEFNITLNIVGIYSENTNWTESTR